MILVFSDSVQNLINKDFRFRKKRTKLVKTKSRKLVKTKSRKQLFQGVLTWIVNLSMLRVFLNLCLLKSLCE
jgi:hypothetical protein